VIMDLHIVWFILLAVLLAGYAVLDGFDLGVGIIHLLARNDEERRAFIGTIGPVWDGNEVWLVVFGGALFAAFPDAYATIFSGFYTALMMALFALIVRAVAIEFRNKKPSAAWRRTCDWAFFGSSLLVSLIFGVGVGNALMGIPLGERGLYRGGFFDLLGVYPILVGVLTVATLSMHGALYLWLELPEGELRSRVREWAWKSWGFFLVLYILATDYTLIAVPHAEPKFEKDPWLTAIGVTAVVASVLAIANIPRSLYRNTRGWAFLSSVGAVVSLVALFSLALWPNLVTASNDPARSLTIYSAAASEKSLGIMLIIALIGMPLALTYTVIVYWTFNRRAGGTAGYGE